MWNWLKKLFTWSDWPAKPAPKGGEDDLYTPGERRIYRYFDGEKDVAVDPMPLWKRLMEHGTDLSIKLRVAYSESKANVQAHTDLVKKIREVFVLKPFEEGGLTESETVNLLHHFLTFVGVIKKNSPSSTTEPGEGTPPTSSPSSEDAPPTRSGSDSTSTATATSTDMPPPSPSASA